jgi:KAT8 regulatory NSL complex subunit 1
LTKEETEAHDEKTIGCFLANLKHLESLDSDATESTSSNDSYDELEGFSHEEIPPKRIIQHPYMKSHFPSNNASVQRQQRMSTSSLTQLNQQTNLSNQRRASHQHSLVDGVAHSSSKNVVDSSAVNMSDLKQKAIWKWAKERSRLASKWTWLQAQIADLEFRVRGQNDSLMQARVRKVPPVPQIIPESTCSRTVPLNKDFRQRRLIKSSQILSDSSKSSVKFSHVPCVCSSLPQTIAPCLSCKGRYNYLKQSEGENVPLLERASLLDPGCHPVLSFPDDITLGSQLSYLLRQETVIRKPTKGKPGRKKGSTSASSTSLATNDDKSGNKYVNKKGKFYQSMSNRQTGHTQTGHHLKNPSQTMIASNKLKRKYRKHSNNTNYDSNNWFNGNYHAHSNNSTKRNKRIRSASSMNESSLHSDSSNPCRPNHFTNNNTARTVTRRRRSEQSAYDIDNIVIPFSVAATTRVEILEYKEIMTPSWRVWENGTCLNDINNVANEPPEEDIEDTSDEAYIQRHQKGEHEEKKRFSLKPPPKNESHNAVPRE